MYQHSHEEKSFRNFDNLEKMFSGVVFPQINLPLLRRLFLESALSFSKKLIDLLSLMEVITKMYLVKI